MRKVVKTQGESRDGVDKNNLTEKQKIDNMPKLFSDVLFVSNTIIP
jgi:hypothetical protein